MRFLVKQVLARAAMLAVAILVAALAGAVIGLVVTFKRGTDGYISVHDEIAIGRAWFTPVKRAVMLVPFRPFKFWDES